MKLSNKKRNEILEVAEAFHTNSVEGLQAMKDMISIIYHDNDRMAMLTLTDLQRMIDNLKGGK